MTQLTLVLDPGFPAAGRGHLSETELAAFMDRTLSGQERSAAAAHLASCAECRAELVAARDAVATLPGRADPRRRFWTIGAVAAAAAIVAAVVLPRVDLLDDTGAQVERRMPERAAAVSTIAPADDNLVDPRDLVLAWSEQPGASYRVTITDESGSTLWSITTGDASVRVPPTAITGEDGRYYWYVDALRADGSSASSGPRSFRTRSP